MVFEANIIIYLQSIGEGWITFFKIITLLGSWLGFALTLMMIFFKNKKLSYTFFVTFLTAVLLNKGIKAIIARPRPYVSFQEILNLGNVGGYSMPSSHAMCAGIIATFILYAVISSYKKTERKRKNKIISISLTSIFVTLFALLICLSRMVLGAHYLTDVLVGLVEGVIISVVGILILKLILKKMKEKTYECNQNNNK